MNKKILYILSNKFSNVDKLLILVNSSYLNIAVDGGLTLAKKYGFQDKISFAIGDFDTCKTPEKIIENKRIIRFPSEKDDADAILAYKYAVSKDKDQLSNLFRKNKINLSPKSLTNFAIDKTFEHHFFSVSGKREDHFISLLFFFINEIKSRKIDALNIIFHNDVETIYILDSGKYTIKGEQNSTFSFFPLDDLFDISFTGSKYTFRDKIYKYESSGLSNIFTKDISTISFKGGLAILSIIDKSPNLIDIVKE